MSVEGAAAGKRLHLFLWYSVILNAVKNLKSVS